MIKSRTSGILIVAAVAVCLLIMVGCGPKEAFPSSFRSVEAEGRGVRIYDTNNDGRADYFQELNENGRVVRLLFDGNKDGLIEQRVDLDRLDPAECRELYVLLDGVPFDLLAEFYEQGHFRLFRRPSRMISTFPSMTDVAFAEIFELSPVVAYEAGYYDHAKGKLHDGSRVYLSGINEPWNALLDYRGTLWMDALGYVWPRWKFDDELKAIFDGYRKSPQKRYTGYSGASACMGTALGRQGYLEQLVKVEQQCEAVMLATRGKVNITIFADHGHNLTKAKPLPLNDLLRKAGFRVTDQLRNPEDVVVPQFGLVTFASINTLRPERVASAAAQMKGINLTLYRDAQENVVVQNRSGRAIVSRRDGRYRYLAESGDPLGLADIVEGLRGAGLLDAEGYAADEDWFAATAEHKYPDALARVWRAFHGLVQNPPTVIVTTTDQWYCGKGKFDFFVDINSTHGSLNAANSLTFAMSTAGGLPKNLRLTDLRKALIRLGLNPP